MFKYLKIQAEEENIELKPQTIHCDFEKGAIKPIKYHFPGIKVIGCHFHYTSAIYKKIAEIGLKNLYSENNKFKSWIRMFMALPFVKLDDIDCCFEELKDTKPEIDEEDKKIEQFIEYFENTWISDQCHFDRSLWNIYDQYSSRTNNISETYNHQINGQVIAPNSNVYKILDVLRKQETLTANKFERVNLGKEKKQTTKQQLKDAKIALLKKYYEHGDIDVMDYLMKLNEFIIKYD